MGLMAGMLPGVECARRRRIRQGAAEAPCGTRRPSLCLFAAGGHDHAHLGSSGSSKERSSTCNKEMARVWTLDSNAREAKERLDQKLRSQRESVVKRNPSTRHSTTRRAQAVSSDGISSNHSATATTAAEEAPTTVMLQREVLTKKDGSRGGAARRRFMWSKLGRRPSPPEAEATMECAVCLDELRAGDVLVHLPCAHRFHWTCAVPWVKAAARCPVCRAQVHLLASSATSPSPPGLGS